MTATTSDAPLGSGRPVKDFSTYCEGDIEPTLNKRIHTLIYECNRNHCIVYLDEDLFVEWSTNTSLPEGFSDIANRIGHLETLSIVLLGRKHIEPFRRLLAEGMARILGDRDIIKAKECIEMAETFLRARSIERARKWYLITSLVVSAIVLILAGLLWLARNEVPLFIGVNAFEVVLGALLGGVGGFMFILMRFKKIEMDSSAGWTIHCLESFARVAMGIAAALFMALAIKADIVLGITKDSDHSLAFLLVLCFVAGWGERFVPSLISRVENLMLEKHETATPEKTAATETKK